MNFRKDINGLRAIAVIAVVLFHFNASWMPGGFAGVDVFFVISGFLMTGIIFRGIEQENFSILKFYIARANRIIPALAVLCLALLIFGWFYLTPLDYKALGKHIASSMGFISNIIYWRESGYFDASSHEKWLLHTWSLSAEWQFYIIYPLVLVALRKFMAIKTLKFIVLIAAIFGFVFCIAVTYWKPNPAYYLLPTRAWEMIVGGIAYLYPITLKEERKKLLEWLGLSLIVGSYLLISKDNPWPGYLALFPVLGAFLIIQAQRNNSIITSNLIFQKLGAWSYSIYLWHWPLVVAIYYFSLNERFIFLGIATSVLLGFLSNKYIENIKFRKEFSSFFSYLSFKPAYLVLCVGLFGTVTFLTKGFSFFQSKSVQKIVLAAEDLNPRHNCLKGDKCIFGEGEPSLILVGDSHALSTVTALYESIADENKSLVFYGLPSCVSLLGNFNDKESSKCNKFMEWFQEDISNNNLPLVIVNSGAYPVGGKHLADPSKKEEPIIEFPSNNIDYHSLYIQRFVSSVCDLSEQRTVYQVRPYPRMDHSVPNYMLKHKEFYENNEFSINKDNYLESHKIVFKAQNMALEKCGAEIIDVTTKLCNDNYCFGSFDSVPIYADSNHLTEKGAKLLIPIFKNIFKGNL